MSPLDIPELDLDGLEISEPAELDLDLLPLDIELPDVTDIEIPEIDLDLSELDFEALKHDPDVLQMLRDCETELTALCSDDRRESPAPDITERRADRRKAERQSHGSSKAAH